MRRAARSRRAGERVKTRNAAPGARGGSSIGCSHRSRDRISSSNSSNRGSGSNSSGGSFLNKKYQSAS